MPFGAVAARLLASSTSHATSGRSFGLPPSPSAVLCYVPLRFLTALLVVKRDKSETGASARRRLCFYPSSMMLVLLVDGDTWCRLHLSLEKGTHPPGRLGRSFHK